MSTKKNEVATVDNANSGVSVAAEHDFNALKLGGGFEIAGVKTVTRPVLKQHDHIWMAVRFDSEIFQGKELTGTKRDGEAKIAPAQLAYVTNLETGEEQTLIVNAALKTGLEDTYPEKAYVGRAFALRSKIRPHDGGKKQIREYEVKELILRKAE